MFTLFHLRERVGVRDGGSPGDDIDLRLGTVSITKSRSRQHEAAPKTEKSVREIRLLPNVLEVLRAMPLPLEKVKPLVKPCRKERD
jgi:hypothetical protein